MFLCSFITKFFIYNIYTIQVYHNNSYQNYMRLERNNNINNNNINNNNNNTNKKTTIVITIKIVIIIKITIIYTMKLQHFCNMCRAFLQQQSILATF